MEKLEVVLREASGMLAWSQVKGQLRRPIPVALNDGVCIRKDIIYLLPAAHQTLA